MPNPIANIVTALLKFVLFAISGNLFLTLCLIMMAYAIPNEIHQRSCLGYEHMVESAIDSKSWREDERGEKVLFMSIVADEDRFFRRKSDIFRLTQNHVDEFNRLAKQQANARARGDCRKERNEYDHFVTGYYVTFPIWDDDDAQTRVVLLSDNELSERAKMIREKGVAIPPRDSKGGEDVRYPDFPFYFPGDFR